MPFGESFGEAGCLSVRELQRRVPLSATETFQRGRTVVFRGEIISKLFMVARGRVHASYETGMGMTTLELRPGDFFGEIAVMEALASDCLVEAASRQTVVLGIPVDCFRMLLAQDELLKRSFLERIADRRTALGAALLGWRAFDASKARASLWSASDHA